MTNVDVLKEMGDLDDIREYLGDRLTTVQKDSEINRMNPLEVMQLWCGWQIGDPSWADSIIKKYDRLINASINRHMVESANR